MPLPSPTDGSLLDLLQRCSDIVVVLDPLSRQVLWSNDALDQWTQEPLSHRSNLQFANLLPEIAAVDELDAALSQGGASEVQLEIQDAAGNCWPTRAELQAVDFLGQEAIGIVIPIPAGHPNSMTGSPTGHRDVVTGLADRSVVIHRLDTLLASERLSDRDFAVLFIDLNGFKQVNDRWGHLVGDELLGEAAERIVGCIRASDQVVRFGGDEFVVLLEGADWQEVGDAVVRRIHAALQQPFSLPDGSETSLSASIGMVNGHTDFPTPNDVLTAADQAMYRAKRLAAAS